jgi:phosphoribosylformylglycinamidine synthase
MKIGVIVFPGSNCDADMAHAWEQISGNKVEMLWHKDHSLRGVDLVVLPGGFSYGDYLRSGAIAQFSPVMQEVKNFAAKGGLVMGVCNGFQILCESGLLPGVLMHNDSHKFICTNVFVRAEHHRSPFTRHVPSGKALKIPIAHGEGKFYHNPSELSEMERAGQVLFRYCDEQGNISRESNPNGALNNIAGICNAGNNVFGMMPHPERCTSEILGNTDGQYIFRSVLDMVSA